MESLAPWSLLPEVLEFPQGICSGQTSKCILHPATACGSVCLVSLPSLHHDVMSSVAFIPATTNLGFHDDWYLCAIQPLLRK